MNNVIASAIIALSCVGYAMSVTTTDTGSGTIYRLEVTQDTWIERADTNYNSYKYLLLGTCSPFPNHRALIQMEDLPHDCAQITWAKMYVYFSGRGKSSQHTVQECPAIDRTVEVRQVHVFSPWNVDEVTSTKRDANNNWTEPYLKLGYPDTMSVQDTVTIHASRPAGYVEFDVTVAMENLRFSTWTNTGMLMRVTNEGTNGQWLVFNSDTADDNPSYIDVLCE